MSISTLSIDYVNQKTNQQFHLPVSVFKKPSNAKEYANLEKILETLIDEVRDNEKHPLAIAMQIIGENLEQYDDEHHSLRNNISQNNTLKIRSASPNDTQWLEELMDREWGGLPLVIRGKKYDPTALDGIIAENENGIAGFLFYEVRGSDCEIIVFEVFDQFKGTGTVILDKLKEIAKEKKCKRIYLMTTNDNLDALRFYQKRNFHIIGIHVDSVKISRKIKSTIGMTGNHDIPVRDEIDLECLI